MSREENLQELFLGDVQGLPFGQREALSFADEASDLQRLPHSPQSLVHVDARQPSSSPLGELSDTAPDGVAGELDVGVSEGRPHGLQDVCGVLTEGLQVADELVREVTDGALMVDGDEMHVVVGPGHVHVEEIFNDLGEGDIVTTPKAVFAGVGS